MAPEPQVLASVLDAIGNTPLIQLNKIPRTEGIRCQVYAKCEYFNAGGSVKDRIAKRMILEAERDGRLKPGFTIIEPTSGNTGIGLALAAAVRGYRCIITMPEKMSQEKVDVLKALGAEIIRTPTEAAWDSPESHISVAKQLNKDIKNSVILNQYDNPNNPKAHFDTTAEEIWEATGGKVDMVVCGAGTGGTITGVARKLKQKHPALTVVGVDPLGSILAQPDTLNVESRAYHVEGIGYDFIPNVLDRALVDKWYKTTDKESFVMARRLIKEEGMLCGGSCGAAMAGAMKAARELERDQVCVVILPDSVRNYMSKFLDDRWMKTKGFMAGTSFEREEEAKSERFHGCTIRDLKLLKAVTINENESISAAVDLMSRHGFSQLPVLSSDTGQLKGLLTLGNLNSSLARNRFLVSDPVSKVMFAFSKAARFVEITPDTKLDSLSTFFEKHSSAVVTEGGVCVHVVTKIDVLNWVVKRSQQGGEDRASGKQSQDEALENGKVGEQCTP